MSWLICGGIYLHLMTQEIIKVYTGGSSLDLHEAVSDHKEVFLASDDHSFVKVHKPWFFCPCVCDLLEWKSSNKNSAESVFSKSIKSRFELFSHPIPSYNGRILS